jgi:hypothetical protein
MMMKAFKPIRRWAGVLLLSSAALFVSASARGEESWTAHGSYDLIVVVPEKFRPREYFSPRKYSDLQGREYPSGTFSLALEDRPAPWLKFYSLSLFDVDGTALNTKGGVYNYDDVFQHKLFGAKFEEAYADLALGPLGLKVGIQKFAWGKLDALAPNDILNPIEAYNPLLDGLSGIRQSKIGIPAVQAGYYLTSESSYLPSETTVQAVWIPFYVPLRFDSLGERWFPPTLGANNKLVVNGTPVDLRLALKNSPPPSRTLDHSSFALRFATTFSGVDLDAYCFNGYQTGFRADGDVLVTLAGLLPPEFHADASVIVRPLFRRLQSLGMAAATTLGPFGLRAEFAFQKKALFSRSLENQLESTTVVDDLTLLLTGLGGRRSAVSIPPLEKASDAVLAGVGIDYSIGGYFLLLQVNQTEILHPQGHLISKTAETLPIASIRKTFFRNRLEMFINGAYDIQAGYSFLEPTFTYSPGDHWTVALGYLKIAGPKNSLLGMFHDNDEGFTRLKWSF